MRTPVRIDCENEMTPATGERPGAVADTFREVPAMAECTCAVVECEKPAKARGLCMSHYHRLQRYGDPTGVPSRDEPPANVRFWGHVVHDSGCWVWTGGLFQSGYGKFRAGPKGTKPRVLAHRFCYELVVGPIPEGLQIDHLCRNRKCVRPDHLEPVTARENQLRSDSASGVNARKTHCPNGHPYDRANTYVWRGQRRCRACW